MITILIYSFISSLSRSGLNIIDRISIGIQKRSINSVTLSNNIFPSIVGILIAVFLNLTQQVIYDVFNLNVLLFSLVLQFVAYSFSTAFKKYRVEDVVISSKFSDFFISAIYISKTVYESKKLEIHDLIDTSLSALSSTICAIYLIRLNPSKSLYLLTLVLVSQSFITPYIAPEFTNDYFNSAVSFTIATLIWRSIFSLLVSTLSMQISFADLFPRTQTLYRASLAILTQAFFIAAITSGNSSLVWAILNMTGAFSIIISLFLFKDKVSLKNLLLLFAVIAITIVRSIYSAHID